jgi:hypothetical protein
MRELTNSKLLAAPADGIAYGPFSGKPAVAAAS